MGRNCAWIFAIALKVGGPTGHSKTVAMSPSPLHRTLWAALVLLYGCGRYGFETHPQEERWEYDDGSLPEQMEHSRYGDAIEEVARYLDVGELAATSPDPCSGEIDCGTLSRDWLTDWSAASRIGVVRRTADERRGDRESLEVMALSSFGYAYIEQDELAVIAGEPVWIRAYVQLPSEEDLSPFEVLQLRYDDGASLVARIDDQGLSLATGSKERLAKRDAISFAPAQWHCLELRTEERDQDMLTTLWLNGDQAGDMAFRVKPQTALERIRVGALDLGARGLGSRVLLDDVVVTPERIGCK